MGGEVKIPRAEKGSVEVDRHCVSLVYPLPHEFNTGLGEILNLEVVRDGEDVLHGAGAEGDRVEVHVVNYLWRNWLETFGDLQSNLTWLITLGSWMSFSSTQATSFSLNLLKYLEISENEET